MLRPLLAELFIGLRPQLGKTGAHLGTALLDLLPQSLAFALELALELLHLGSVLGLHGTDLLALEPFLLLHLCVQRLEGGGVGGTLLLLQLTHLHCHALVLQLLLPTHQLHLPLQAAVLAAQAVVVTSHAGDAISQNADLTLFRGFRITHILNPPYI